MSQSSHVCHRVPTYVTGFPLMSQSSHVCHRVPTYVTEFPCKSQSCHVCQVPMNVTKSHICHKVPTYVASSHKHVTKLKTSKCMSPKIYSHIFASVVNHLRHKLSQLFLTAHVTLPNHVTDCRGGGGGCTRDTRYTGIVGGCKCTNSVPPTIGVFIYLFLILFLGYGTDIFVKVIWPDSNVCTDIILVFTLSSQPTATRKCVSSYCIIS